MIQAVRDLQRLRDIARVIARHGFGELLDRARIWDVLGRREEVSLTPEEQRRSSAARFRELLAELGPTFIKLGQILSSRPDILPPDFIAELSKLQDNAPALPHETVLQLIEQGLGKPASALFASIEPQALATASIAQVHRARLLPAKDAPPGSVGASVVVKVQRPGIEEKIKSDTDLLSYLARFLEGVMETGIYTPTGIVAEFRAAMLTELDFEIEAGNIEEFAKNHVERPKVVIPTLYRELSCKTVITLGELVGIKLSEVLKDPGSNRWDRKELRPRRSSTRASTSSSPTASSTAIRTRETCWSSRGIASGCSTSGWWGGCRSGCRSRSSCWSFPSACATRIPSRGSYIKWGSLISGSTSTSSAPISTTYWSDISA